MGCSFAGCPKPHYSGGLCVGHYRQRSRGTALKPLRPVPTEESSQLAFRMPVSLRKAVQADAERLELEESEWVRKACEEKLARGRKGEK